MEDKGGNGDAGATTLSPRSIKDTSATARATVEMPMATHGAIVCAFHVMGATGSVRDMPHSWHSRQPALTVALQDGQVDTIGVPQ
jgi:hypothetical protein